MVADARGARHRGFSQREVMRHACVRDFVGVRPKSLCIFFLGGVHSREGVIRFRLELAPGNTVRALDKSPLSANLRAMVYVLYEEHNLQRDVVVLCCTEVQVKREKLHEPKRVTTHKALDATPRPICLLPFLIHEIAVRYEKQSGVLQVASIEAFEKLTEDEKLNVFTPTANEIR